ncbi:hypothetical protein BKA70DRAFT_504681 [Coprinopsis sp. MPI-PUGE-AT-0042]|nr:hypothetical protein BKA70DRAFT_504681 [Coprinopsis sp. MPI-PUGE-AT-0042]
MHRCLQTPDILSTIFESFSAAPIEPYDDLPPGFASLASLARTCKTFQVPAIRALWRDIPGIYVIACLFQPQALVLDNENRYDVSRSSPIDFGAFTARLSVYRHYVKSIGYPRTPEEGPTPKSLHTSVLYLLMECPIVSNPLFPNVYHVTIPCFKDSPLVSLFYPRLILGPSVRSLNLDTDDVMLEKADSPGEWYPDGDATQWDVIESALMQAAPTLCRLCIQMPERNAVAQPLERLHADRIVQHLSPSLTNIDLSAVIVMPATMMVIASLPTLAALAVALSDKNSQLVEDDHPLSLQFPALTSLRIVLEEDLDKHDFVARLDAPVMRNCAIAFRLVLDENEDCPVDTILNSFFQRTRQSLTHFAIDNQTADQYDWSIHSLKITPNILTQLSRCPNLAHLTVGPLAVLGQITDEDLLSAFSCWPKLETVCFSIGRCDPESLSLTAKGVYEAAKACPRLHYLALPCDFRVLSDASQDAELNHVLKIWSVCNSPIKSGTNVGLWLKSRFAGLQHLMFSNYARDLVFNSVALGFGNPWPSHKGDLIELTEWIQVQRVLREGSVNGMVVDR